PPSIGSMRRALAVVLALGGAGSAWADVRLPALLSDHAVPQGGPRTRGWGTGEPGEPVGGRPAGRGAGRVCAGGGAGAGGDGRPGRRRAVRARGARPQPPARRGRAGG